MAEAAENQADVGRLEDIDGADDFLSWLSFTAGNAIPSLATTIAGGGIGGFAAKAAIKKKAKSEAEKYAEKRVKDASETALRRKVADDYTRNALSKAGMRGATAGAVGVSTTLSAGESFTRIMEETGEERAGVALATGVAAGLLDAAAPLAALKRILPKGTYQRALNQISDDVMKKRGRVSRALNEAAKIGGVEGLTELTQEILQTSSVQLVEAESDPEMSDKFFSELFNETNRSIYLNAFAAGVVGGGLVGGTMGLTKQDKVATEEQVSDQEIFDRATGKPAREDEKDPVDQEQINKEEAEALEDVEANRVAARDQARAEADANPERTNERTGGFGTRQERQELARKSVQRQLGMRLNQHLKGRQQAKQISKQMGLDLRDPPDPVPEPVPQPQEEIPVFEPAPLAQLEGQMVSYQGIEGMLVRNENGFFVENDEQSTLIESGEVATPEQLGIEVIDNTANRERDVKFTSEDKKLSGMPATLRMDGKVYTYQSTNTNEAGETVSITATTADGQSRTFRNPEVVERFERQIVESEQGDPMQALIDLETLPIEVQEAVMEQAEAQQQPMPDEIPVDEAVSIAQAIDPEMAEQVQEAASVSTVMRDRKSDIYDDFKPYSSVTTTPTRGVPDALVTNKQRAESTLQNQAGDSLVVDVVADQDLNDLTNSDSRIKAHRGPDGERVSRNFNDLSDPQKRTLEKALVDVVSSGVPVQLFRDLNDVRVFNKQDANGSATVGYYDTAQNILALKTSELGNRGGKQASDLRWTITHEMSHALDTFLGKPSENDPRFQLQLADKQLAINVHKVEMGEAMNELYENFMNDTPLGRVLEYPFVTAFHGIKLNREAGNSNDRWLKTIQREAFAQAFATYFSNPLLLKDNAPTAYDFIRESIDAYRNQGETAPRESTEVPGEVSAPAPTGGIQDGDSDVRQGSEDSPVQEQASEEVGGTQSESDGLEIDLKSEYPDFDYGDLVIPPVPASNRFQGGYDYRGGDYQESVRFDRTKFKVYHPDITDGSYFELEHFSTGKARYNFYPKGELRPAPPTERDFQTVLDSMNRIFRNSIPSALMERRRQERQRIIEENSDPTAPVTFGAGQFSKEFSTARLSEKRKALIEQADALTFGDMEIDPSVKIRSGKDFLSYTIRKPNTNLYADITHKIDGDLYSTQSSIVAGQIGVLNISSSGPSLQSAIDGTVGQMSADRDEEGGLLDIAFSVLSPEAQQITASTVLYGDQDIAVTPETNKVTITDLAKAFDERVSAATDRDLSEQTPENKEIISDLIAHEASEAMQREGNAGDWYQQKVANAMDLAAQAYPELASDPNARMAFTAITAITSNGASVQENSENAFAAYADYRQNKKFPNFGAGKEAPAMRKGFELLNRLQDELGADGLREFLNTETTVRELKQEGFTISGELMDERVYGSAILGPKIGQGFYQNLNGNYDPLTMDRWFMRTWGRLTGSMMKESRRKIPDALKRFRDAAELSRDVLRADKVSIVQLRKDDELAKNYANKVYGRFSSGSFKDKSALNNASRSVKQAMAPMEAPNNGGHRQWIREVMRSALDKVNAEADQPINMGALQAIVWYPEKDLYKQLGVGNKRSEPTDYETEFRKIVEQGQLRGQGIPRSGGPEQQSRAGDVQPEDGQATDQLQSDQEQTVLDIPATATRGKPSPDLNLAELQEEKLSRPSSEVTNRERIAKTVETMKADRKSFIADKWQGFIQGVFDDVNRIGFYERQMNEGELFDGADSAYKAALWSKNVSVVSQAAMEAGPIELKDGAFQLVEGEQGFFKIFKDYTKEELRDWELWAAANRASRLIKEDRERLFSQDDIDKILDAADQAGVKEKYQQSLDSWIKYNRKMLDLAEQSGILDRNKRKVWDKDDYVPFFRFEDESDTNDLQNDQLRIRRGLDGQGMNVRQLVGGEGKINPLESMVSQITTTLDRSFKNEAMRRLVKNMDGMDDVLAEVPASPSNLELASNPENNLVKVYFDGKAKVYQVKDPVLLRSIQGVGGYELDALGKAFSIPKAVLTRGVTLDPGFMIANAFRDLLATSIQFPNAPNPVTSITKAVKYISSGVTEEVTGNSESTDYLKSKQSLYKIMASGGLALGDFYGSGQSENIRNDINRINSLDTTLNTPEKLERFHKSWLDLADSKRSSIWQKWNRIGGKFEQASRINLYEGAIANGETHAEAVSQAADILNFSRRGDYQLIKFMVNAYPFFNARLQGLNVLGRSIASNPQHVLGRGGALALASIALYMINKDDERYEQLPDYDKDNNFHFFLGDEHYRLPKPFELGLIFGTLPERMATYAIEEDKDMEYLFDGVRDGVVTTLSIDLFPQVVKPLVDVLSNEDPFRERPIVSRALEDAPPEMQFNEFTSDTAKAIAQSMPDIAPDVFRSPIYLEYLLKGYLGTISGYGLQVTDNIVRDPDLPIRPEMMPSQYPVLKRFYRTGIQTSKYGTEFYELRKFADDLYLEHKTLVENGRTQEAQNFLNRNGGYDEVRRGINQYYKKIKQINKKRDLIYKDRQLSASEKARRLRELTTQRNELYREAVKKYDDYL